MSATQGAWECKHGVDGRDWCEECHSGVSANAIDNALTEVRREVERAVAKFGPFASPHEGYAVIQEEVDELWHEVKHGSRTSAHPEAVQVAAMAVRFLIDLYGEKAT